MKKYGVIGAMDVEVALFRDSLEQQIVSCIAGIEFVEGVLNGCPVVIVKSGVGKVNAALCAQLLISRFAVDGIINTGAAGAFGAGLGVLDLVVSTEVIYHDVDVTAWGYECGMLPGMPAVFTAEKELIRCAEAACRDAFPDRMVVCGRVASGDQFISTAQQKAIIREKFNPVCVEMEGAAVGHICSLYQKPFVIIRCMSDMADDSGKQTAEFNEETAGHTSAAVVANLVKWLQ